MRYLVYLLLAANLAYLGWNLSHDGTRGVAQRELPPLPAGAQPLVTLQELEQKAATATGENTAGLDTLTMTQPPSVGLQDVCRTLGPFRKVDDLQAVTDRLGTLGLKVRQRVVEGRKQDGYWVYLPVMGRARALEIAQRLEALDDSDYYIGKENFISLGMFQDMSRAEIRLQQVRRLGLDAVLEARYVRQDSYWLDFPDRAVSAPVLAEMLDTNPELRLEPPAVCQGGA